ncbi:Rne/Rng family ribonuclease [Pseudovibrio sp. SPO723]|uniref:Rne/Rng family ribonuclease n=1 Tax=Nesiotobacter zosterae TaxID=392721 RepID=UPI0029C1D1E7|nr:Rne/Rng family ribonuclease [Pseudovibrio sp. SPO723]MDX5592679.1 Rne/Rng family ribonuclease [Pseudovibrio sp. SPO723]
MANKMLIDATHPEETRVTVVRGNRVEEFDFEAANRKQLRGNIYLAKVTRVEPSLQAAFVEYGGNRHGFLAFSEIHPDYYQLPKADREAFERQLAEEAAAHQRERERREREEKEREESKRSAARRSDQDDDVITEDMPEDEDALDDDSDLNAPDDDDEDSIEEIVPEGASYDDDDDSSDSEATDTTSDEDEVSQSAPTAKSGSDSSDDDETSSDSADAADDDNSSEALSSSNDSDDSDDDEASDDDDEDGDAEQAQARGDRRRRSRGSRRRRSRKGRSGDDKETRSSDDAEEISSNDSDSDDDFDIAPERARRLRDNYKIQEVIKRRQLLLVQVVKEERGNKGAALTTYLSLAGRYSVLMPNTDRGGGISRKITKPTDRKRLKEIAQDLGVPVGMGVILRTAGASRTKAEIRRDFEYLMRLWENVRELTLSTTAPNLVYEEGSLIKRSIRDLYNKDIDQVLVAGEEAYREAKNFMRMLMPSHSKNVQPYRDVVPVFNRFGVEAQLDAMFSPEVTLKSGGYIVINQTEALVSIDVNSGKSTREQNIEDTALATNMEAAEEIARQLRLRDLAGLVVIDFIDMEEGRNNRAVERKLKECLKADRARIQVGRISHFGLLEMSRQRLRTGVLESSSVVCPHCRGSGIVRSTESLALHILRSVEEQLLRNASHDLIIRTPTEVALYVLNHKRDHLISLEQRFGPRITVQADDSVTGEHFTLERGEPVSASPRPQVMPVSVQQDALPPVEDYEDIEADEEAEVEATNDEEEEDREEKSGRRRRRRRRRRDKRDQDQVQAEGDEAEASEDQEADSEASADGEATEAKDGNEDGSEDEDGYDRRRRRRRGRRGGRRSRRNRKEDGELEAADGNDDASSEGSEGAEDAAVVEATEQVDASPEEAEKAAETTEQTDASKGAVTAEEPAAQASPEAEAKSVQIIEIKEPASEEAPAAAAAPLEEAAIADTEASAPSGDEGAQKAEEAEEATKTAETETVEAAQGVEAASEAPREEAPIAEEQAIEAEAAPVEAQEEKEEATPSKAQEPILAEVVSEEEEPVAAKPAAKSAPAQPVVTSEKLNPDESVEMDKDAPRRTGWWQRRSFF